MKIGFDAKKAFNNTAGLGQYSRTLINGLIGTFPENEFHLFSSKQRKSLIHSISGEYILHKPSGKFHKAIPPLWRSFGMSKDIITSKIDLFHGLSNELPLSTSKLNAFKKIVTVHDVIFLKHKEQYHPIDRKVYDYKMRKAVSQADIVVAISEETKKDLQQYYKVPENKIHVIYQSCSPQFYVTQTQERLIGIKEKYNLPDKYILNVSSFNSRKNHQTMVEAFELLQNKTDTNLIFVGNQGDTKDDIISLIAKKKLSDRIILLPNVTNEELPALYQQASAFLYPSLFEGFGIPILEALYSKVPVITTMGGCFKEVGGKQSIYINPLDAQQMADAISLVLSDGSYRHEIIANGYEHAKSMSEKSFIQNTMNLYKSI